MEKTIVRLFGLLKLPYLKRCGETSPRPAKKSKPSKFDRSQIIVIWDLIVGDK